MRMSGESLKEREGNISGDGKFSGIPKMRMSGESLKEREGNISGDGKFSGFPKMKKGTH